MITVSVNLTFTVKNKKEKIFFAANFIHILEEKEIIFQLLARISRKIE